MPRHVFQVEVETQHTSGKFAGRDEIAEAILEWLQDANDTLVHGIGVDGESEYEVVDWSIEEIEPPKHVRRRK